MSSARRALVVGSLLCTIGCSGDPGPTTGASATETSTTSTSESATDSASSTSSGSTGDETTPGTTTGAAPLCGDGIVVAGEVCYGSPIRGGLAGLPLALGVADLDDDGREDLLVGLADGGWVPLYGDGSTLVPGEAVMTPDAGVNAITAADLDGDGIVEVITALSHAASGSIDIFAASGDTYVPASSIMIEGTSLDVLAADLDQDGALDLIHNSYSKGTLSALRGDGLGGFSPWQTIDVGERPRGMAVADIEGDGESWIVVALEGCTGGYMDPNATCGPSKTAIVRGFSGEGMPSMYNLLGPKYNDEIVMVDLGLDGAVDVAAITANCGFEGLDYVCGPATFEVYSGEGDGDFSGSSVIVEVEGTAVSAGVSADFDGDDAPDLAVAHLGPDGADPLGRVTIFTAGELAVTELVGGTSYVALAALEINGDGVPDLVAADTQELALQIFLSDP